MRSAKLGHTRLGMSGSKTGCGLLARFARGMEAEKRFGGAPLRIVPAVETPRAVGWNLGWFCYGVDTAGTVGSLTMPVAFFDASKVSKLSLGLGAIRRSIVALVGETLAELKRGPMDGRERSNARTIKERGRPFSRTAGLAFFSVCQSQDTVGRVIQKAISIVRSPLPFCGASDRRRSDNRSMEWDDHKPRDIV